MQGCSRRTGSLVSGNRTLSLYASRIHLRSAAACRLILCTGSLIHVCRYGYPTVRKRTGDDAGSMCCPWRKVDCRKSCLARRESALQQRTYAHPLTDSCRKRTEVRPSGYDCYQQLSPRLQEIEIAVWCDPYRCSLLRRRNVPQRWRGYRRMEYPECEQLLAAAARNRIGYLELSEARRYPDLLYLHLQCARRWGERCLDMRRTWRWSDGTGGCRRCMEHHPQPHGHRLPCLPVHSWRFARRRSVYGDSEERGRMGSRFFCQGEQEG